MEVVLLHRERYTAGAHRQGSAATSPGADLPCREAPERSRAGGR
jgi:hypothetical protein